VQIKGRRLRVEIGASEAVYTLVDGSPMEICHYGERFTVLCNEPRRRKIQRQPRRPEPHQPPGRRPASRH
jgi:alpha,alpha-trehalose phosphorylase